MDSRPYIGVAPHSVMLAPRAVSEPKRLAPGQESRELEYWGPDNLEPEHLLRDIASNSVLNDALSWKVKALYSGGLQYGYSDGEAFSPASIPQVDAMLKESHTTGANTA